MLKELRYALIKINELGFNRIDISSHKRDLNIQPKTKTPKMHCLQKTMLAVTE